MPLVLQELRVPKESKDQYATYMSLDGKKIDNFAA